MKLVNVNHKGGVGKTTNTIHIGAELKNRGYKVLLIDADNQCDLTAGVGVKNIDYTIIDFLENQNKEIKFATIDENFHLLGGSLDFTSERYNRFSLAKVLKSSQIENYYDFILIDVPPTGINQTFVSSAELALCATDFVIIPLQADMFSVKNIFGFIKKVLSMKEYNPNLKLLGAYFTNVLTTTGVFTQYYQVFKEENSEYFFDTFIRRDMEVIKASIEGKTIFEYNDKCRASDDFKNLVTEILDKIKKWQKV